jgi:hypothetical protein
MRTDRYWLGCFLLLLMTAGLPAAAQTCGPWTRIGAEPPFGGASLNSVTHGDGVFVAVGDGGLIVTSPDGVAWTRQESGETADLRGVAWSGARYVAVGGWGVVLVSEDAASWRRVVVAFDQQLTAATWSGSRFLAVGDGATVLSSTDGEVWETVATGGGDWVLRSVACGGGVCVAGGSYLWSTHYGGTMLRSTDGLTWKPVAAESEFPLQAFDLMWTGERFVAAGSRFDWPTVGWSDGGETWEYGPNAAAAGPTRYSAVATDGLETLVFGDAGRVQASPDGCAWSERASTLGYWVNDVVWTDGRWVAVGWQGQTAVSEDGDRWDTAAPGLFDSFPKTPAARNGSVIVAAASDATSWHPVVYRTSDGTAWQQQVLVGSPRMTEVETFAGGFLALTADGVASSPDGVAWTAHPLAAPSPGLEGLACSPARCVAVGKEIVTSEDGVTWSRSPLPAGVLAAHDVVWTGTRFVAVGHLHGASPAVFLESLDGLSWQVRTQQGLEPPTTLANHGGRLVALGGGQGRVFTAAEGQPWTVVVLPSYDNLREVVWTGGFFAAFGRKPDNVHPALWVSVGGTAWSEVAVPAGDDLRGIFGDGSRLYLFGERGTILSTSCGGYATGRAPSRRLSAVR